MFFLTPWLNSHNLTNLLLRKVAYEKINLTVSLHRKQIFNVFYLKNVRKIKNVKNVKNVTRIKKNIKTFFYTYDFKYPTMYEFTTAGPIVMKGDLTKSSSDVRRRAVPI